jgi:hypothetical protein
VARAKSTARAEARRRHRAEQAAADGAQSGAEGLETGTTTKATAGASAKPGTAPGRVGLGSAFRDSFRPIDLRGDLRALPYIAIHTKALWLPLLLTIGTTIAFYFTQGTDVITKFLFAYFIQTPAIGGVFIAGFLAPRAAWLLGAIVGFVSAICYSVLLFALFSAVLSSGTTGTSAWDIASASLVLSPTIGALFAAAAAWYRRFLSLSNPNRGRQAPAAKRGPDGKTRGGNQKAGARR